MSDRQQLMRQIQEICFVVDDLTLYLDTHPLDGDALDEIDRAMTQRKTLLCTYAKRFEPLIVNCIHVGPEAGQEGTLGAPPKCQNGTAIPAGSQGGVAAPSNSQSGQPIPTDGQGGQNARSNNQSGQYTKYAGRRHWTWTDGPLPWEGGIA